QSRIWRAYTGFDLRLCTTSDADILKTDRMRFTEIVKAANVIAHQKYDCPLVVILWDVAKTGSARQNINWIEATLLENKILTLKLSNAITEPDFKNWIIRRDGHPDPRAYREVAKTLVSWLQQNPSLLAPSLSKESRPADQN